MQSKAEAKPILLYIAGAGHSGSSLLDYLLGAAPDIVPLGEFHRLSIAPSERRCSCLDTIANCPYWEDLRHFHADRTATRLPSWEDLPLSLQPSTPRERMGRTLTLAAIVVGLRYPPRTKYSRGYQVVVQNSWEAYESIAIRHQAYAVVDSTKNPLRLFELYRSRPSQLYAIHLVRDGRAVAASQVRRTGASWLSAVLSWRATQFKVERALGAVKADRRLLVRYEDLCKHPEQEINRIREHIGLATKTRLDRIDREGHMIPGNPVLLSGITEVRRDDRWVDEIPSWAEGLFRILAGSKNRSFGYQSRVRVKRSVLRRFTQ